MISAACIVLHCGELALLRAEGAFRQLACCFGPACSSCFGQRRKCTSAREKRRDNTHGVLQAVLHLP